MRRKLICLIIILSIISSLYSEIIVHNVKIKTKDELKKTGKILCVGKKGVIFWKSKIPYNIEFLNNYTEYIPYTEILYVKTSNRLDLYPLLIGVSIGTVSATVILNSMNDDPYSIFIAGALAYGGFLYGLIGSIVSLFIPRHNKPSKFTKKYSTNKSYIMFVSNIPPELKIMLEKYEK